MKNWVRAGSIHPTATLFMLSVLSLALSRALAVTIEDDVIVTGDLTVCDTIIGNGAGLTNLSISQSTNFVRKAGDTMTGPLVMSNASINLTEGMGSRYVVINRPDPTNTDGFIWHKSVGSNEWLSGVGVSGSVPNDNNYRIVEANGAGWTTRFSVQKGTGYIGVGTNNPMAQLDVAGSIKVGGGASFSAVTVSNVQVNGTITANALAGNGSGITNLVSGLVKASLCGPTNGATLAALGMTTNQIEILVDGGVWRITNNLTLPSNVALRFAPGSMLDIGTGCTVTVHGAINCGVQQIVDGDVGGFDWLFTGRPKCIPAEWIGVQAEQGSYTNEVYSNEVYGVHSNAMPANPSNPSQAAANVVRINSYLAGRWNRGLQFGCGWYYVNDSILAQMSVLNGVAPHGQLSHDWSRSVVVATPDFPSGKSVIDASRWGSNAAYGMLRISNLLIHGNRAAYGGVVFTAAQEGDGVYNTLILGCVSRGVEAYGGQNYTLDNVDIGWTFPSTGFIGIALRNPGSREVIRNCTISGGQYSCPSCTNLSQLSGDVATATGCYEFDTSYPGANPPFPRDLKYGVVISGRFGGSVAVEDLHTEELDCGILNISESPLFVKNYTASSSFCDLFQDFNVPVHSDDGMGGVSVVSMTSYLWPFVPERVGYAIVDRASGYYRSKSAITTNQCGASVSIPFYVSDVRTRCFLTPETVSVSRIHVSGGIVLSNADINMTEGMGSRYVVINRPDPTNTDGFIWHKSVGSNEWLSGVGVSGSVPNDNNYRIVEANGAGWTTRFSVQKGTGYIGVGTNNPMAQLDVAGSIKVGGGASFSAVTVSNVQVNGTITANALAGNGSGITNLGSANLNAGSVGAAQLGSAVVTGDKLASDVDDRFVNSSGDTMTGSLVLCGSSLVFTNGLGKRAYFDSSGPGLGFFRLAGGNGSTSIVSVASNFFGLGQIVPSEMLHVNGNAIVTGAVKATWFVGDGSSLSNLGSGSLNAGAVTSEKILDGGVSVVDLATDVESRYVNAGGDKITGTLVFSNADINMTEGMGSRYVVINRPDPTNTDGFIWHKSTGSNEWLSGVGVSGSVPNDNNYRIVEANGAGWTTRFSVQKGTGYIGIGTNSPNASLDVNGSLRVSGGTLFGRLQAGTLSVGTNATGFGVYTAAFPVVFASSPAVVCTPRLATSGSNETFMTTIRTVSVSNFVLSVRRGDTNSAWGVPVSVSWFAWE